LPSNAHKELLQRLKDVEELIMAHGVVTGGGRGRPAQRQGAAITRSGIVLLSAATEAFVEDLFEEAASIIFWDMAEDERIHLFRNTSRKLNNADTHKTELLYFNIGLPWILKDISWKKYPNHVLRGDLNKLIDARNKIAHGHGENVRLSMLRRWKNMIEMLAPRLEEKVLDHVCEWTGETPDW
jgi:hypothetical protein